VLIAWYLFSFFDQMAKNCAFFDEWNADEQIPQTFLLSERKRGKRWWGRKHLTL
jgi:hypothetical protein